VLTCPARERPSNGAERKRELRRGGVAVEIEGGGAQNAGKERVRVGQLDDEGSGWVIDDVGDSQALKPKACRCAAMRSW